MLTVTDGFQTIEAMEHQVIKAIPDVVTPGMKIQVLGPVTVRRGVILLTSNSMRVLGGGRGGCLFLPCVLIYKNGSKRPEIK